MTTLEIYQTVGQTKNLTELLDVVKSIKGTPLFTDEQIDNFTGTIQSLIDYSKGTDWIPGKIVYSRLTRTFGIRQQAIMLETYKKY